MTGHERDRSDHDAIADTALREALAVRGGLDPVALPPTLLDGAARRLPGGPPAAARDRERSARRTTGIVRAGVGLLGALALASGPAAGGAVERLVQADGGVRTSIVNSMTSGTVLLALDSLTGRAALGVIVALTLLLLPALLLVRWPGRTAVAGRALLRRPNLALAAGLPLALALAALLPPAALLARSLVGLPLAAALIAVSLALLSYGLAAVARAAGARAAGRAAPAPALDEPTIAAALALALAIGTVAALAWPWWVAACAVLAAPGLGAVALTRLGTRQGD